MDAVEAINAVLNPRDILEHYHFQHINETNDSIRACCGIHNGDNPTGFVWNKSNNLWYCYTGDCGGGDIFTLIQKIECVDFKTAVLKAAEIVGVDIQNYNLNLSENHIKKEQLKWLEKQNRMHKKQEIKKYCIPEMKYKLSDPNFKRFDSNTISHFGGKFYTIFPTETNILKHKLLIPLYKGYVTVGVALRDTTGINVPKWFYQPKGLPMGQLLYNFNEDEIYEEIILVEGIFDVWRFYEIGIHNVVAVFGSAVSDEQYKTILKTGAAVTMCFDNDTAGHKATVNTAKKFRNKAELKYIQLPDGKDPGDCTHNELMTAYLKRTKYAQE